MSDESPKITLKAGTGYDAPWITLPFDNPDEAKVKLAAIRDSGLLADVAATAELFHGVYRVTKDETPAVAPPPLAPIPPAQSPGWGQPTVTNGPPQQPAPQQAGVVYHPENKACQCGQILQWKEFTSKSNKLLKMWTCPLQKRQNDGHLSEFVWDS